MIIYYDPEFNDYSVPDGSTQKLDLITDLPRFIATALKLGETIKIIALEEHDDFDYITKGKK